MMLIILIIVIIVVAVIGAKIENAKYRARQQILKNTGFSSSEMDNKFTEELEKRRLEKFLEEYPEYTEEKTKTILKEYAVNIINKTQKEEFSEKVNNKIIKDKKLEKLREMTYKTINIIYYKNQKLTATALYTDNKDDYKLYLYCDIVENKINVNTYQIEKGAVVGF